MIIAAAIKFGDVVCFTPRPGRHHHVLHGLHEHHGTRTLGYDTEVQGFITDKGDFLGRREALVYAKEHGQLLPRSPAGYK